MDIKLAMWKNFFPKNELPAGMSVIEPKTIIFDFRHTRQHILSCIGVDQSSAWTIFTMGTPKIVMLGIFPKTIRKRKVYIIYSGYNDIIHRSGNNCIVRDEMVFFLSKNRVLALSGELIQDFYQKTKKEVEMPEIDNTFIECMRRTILDIVKKKYKKSRERLELIFMDNLFDICDEEEEKLRCSLKLYG